MQNIYYKFEKLEVSLKKLIFYYYNQYNLFNLVK